MQESAEDEFARLLACNIISAMARKLGIVYNDTTADLIKDQLEHGDT